MEVNILMKEIIKNTILSIVVKIILPAILLYFVYKRMKKANEKQLKTANVLTNIICVFYALVITNNFIWLLTSI